MSRRQVRILEGSTFGQRLRHARQRKGFTQEGLARSVDMTLRTVQRWEADETAPGGVELLAMAVVLDVDAADLFPIEEAA
jgi:transcriptional regulator with XRE-family HTH domain